MMAISDRVAGAPISWGVCEVPGWGYQMAPARVLDEMGEVGLHATELGPPGYLPPDPGTLAGLLEEHHLRLAAGFLAVVLHRRDTLDGALAVVERASRTLSGAGAEVLVVAAAAERPGYERRQPVDKGSWKSLADAIDRCQEIAAAAGLELAFHPHVGTLVESEGEIDCLLEISEVGLCLDTGHLFLGGANPAVIAGQAAGRVRHVHMKDVDGGLAARLAGGELSYAAAVRAGLYRTLGQGDLDIEAVYKQLEDAGYRGWYVLEQDAALAAEPERARGPVLAARHSLDYFRALSAARNSENGA